MTRPLLALSCLTLLLSTAACSTAQNLADSSLFECSSGEVIAVSYPDTDTVLLRYQDRQYRLKNAVSASGARYVGDGLEWWSKGSGTSATASLATLQPNGESGQVLELCVGQ